MNERFPGEASLAAECEAEDAAWLVRLRAEADAYLATGDAAALLVAVEVAHAERYPAGCPNGCEGCAARLLAEARTTARAACPHCAPPARCYRHSQPDLAPPAFSRPRQ